MSDEEDAEGSDDEEVPNTVVGEELLKPDNNIPNDNSMTEKQISDDPFGVYELLNKSCKCTSAEEDVSIPHPLVLLQIIVAENDNSPMVTSKVMNFSHISDINESSCGVSSPKFNSNMGKGGSILNVLDDLIRVGQSMGYDMEGWLFFARILHIYVLFELLFVQGYETEIDEAIVGGLRDWRHPWDPTLRTLPKSRMTKQGNFTQRTPQAKKQSDQASRQISKQASGSANAPYDLVFTAMGPPLGTTQTTATITSAEGLQRATFTTPPQTVPGTNTTEPPPPPLRNKGPELGADNLTLEGVATELAPSDFVSQNYETLVALMQEETKKRSSQSLQARLNFGPEDEVSPPRHQKERRGKDNRRPPVFGRIGKKVSGTQTANLQNLDTHENNDWRISVRDRLGSRDVHSRLGQRRSPSESPPSSDSEDSRRKRRRRVSSSSEDSSDNEDAETGHWKSKNKYREDEDEDMSRPWRRQKVDAFTRRISDFSEDKKRRMPANVKTYDGTGDPDDHLKIFESAATIENWPQPVWCHMFNSTLVGNARNWFSKLPRRSIDGFEELRRAFRLNFTQRKKCAKNPVELARVKQRQGESTSAYVERYKDECIHVKACPEILKISGFMNGINNPELIKRLNDRVPQTFDELMKRTRSFIQGEAAAADSRKGYSNNRSQEQSRRQSNDQSSSRNNSYRGQRGGRGNDKYTPLTMTPKEILATEGANFPRPPPMRTPEEQRVGNGYCEYHRQKGHTTNECVQLRQLIDKLVKEGRLDHLVKNIKEGKDKQRSGGKKDAPRDKADTIYMVQSMQAEKLSKKVSQKFFAWRGHDIHRIYIDGGASADILYEHYFQRLRPEEKRALHNSMDEFYGDQITIAIQWHYWKTRNLSDTRGPIHGLRDAKIPRRRRNCHHLRTSAAPPKECNTVTCDVTQRQHATKVTNLKVAIHPDYPEQEVSIGRSLSDTGRAAVCALLQRNHRYLSWETKNT
ncbi:reverse transcriptase domain-containing protein [Tanacetum coccineum]|uniref:Reverse transcriptase domain-containing protein n=1 Tax=Tanacetum coccineum TaxID=301880 RepID=A0ABQ4YWP1_9ASTR